MSNIIALHYHSKRWEKIYQNLGINVELYNKISQFEKKYKKKGRESYKMGIVDNYDFGWTPKQQKARNLISKLIIKEQLPLLLIAFEQAYYSETFPIINANRWLGGIDIQIPQEQEYLKGFITWVSSNN